MSKRKTVFRGIRKGAYLTRKVTSKAANFSGRVENKADRIIHGTDPTILIHEKVLQEQIFSEALPEITSIHPAMPIPGRKAAVNLLIPSLQNSSFFGGTATALIFAAKVAQEKKMPLRVVETLKHGNTKAFLLQKFLAEQGFKFNISDIVLMNLAGRKHNHYGYIDMHPEDVFIASAWWDAHLLDKLPLLQKFIYLIQDFEPIFYNNSDQYILAEETYNNTSFIPVFNTELMYEFMKKRGYKGIPKENALFFEPAINIGKKIGYSKKKKAGSKQILFIYGRPSVHRNLFYRAIEAVDKAFATEILTSDKWEVYMAGQDKLPNILLDSGVTVKNLGKMSMEEYYDFAKTVDLGVSLMMAPHPSYPPLELASLGAAVVTTSYKTKTDLTKYCNNIFVQNSTLDSLVDGIKKAGSVSYETRLKNAELASYGVIWNETLDKLVKKLSKEV